MDIFEKKLQYCHSVITVKTGGMTVNLSLNSINH